MGLLGNLLKTISGTTNVSSADQGTLSTIMELINNQGGTQNIVNKLKQAGLTSIVDSWIGTGKNKSVNASQISNILGSDLVAQLASKLGISNSAAASTIAKFLPLIIDKLTPQGNAASLGQNINIQDILGSFLKK